MTLNYDWREMDIYLSVHDMREVLRSYGISVETEDKRNKDGGNEVHFWMYRNGRTLHRELYEYDLGSIENIQKHRRYFIKEILDAFENAEKAASARVHIMGICEMIAKLDERGFKARSDYDPRKKVYKIWVGKGDWHCVREVDWCDVLDDCESTIARQARHRQDTLESIFEAYKKEETKRVLNSLYGGTCPLDREPKYVYVTTACRCQDSTFRQMFEKYAKEALAEKEREKVSIQVNVDDLARLYQLELAANISDTKKEQKKEMKYKLPEIKKVIFNNPATIVFWADGTKTIVKCQENDIYDPEKGLAMAITKKALGNEGNYFDTIKKWTGDKPALKEISYEEYLLENFKSDCQAAYNKLKDILDNKKATKADLIVAMEETIGYLGEVLE